MARVEQRSRPAGGATGGSRPSLEPADPLKGSTAFLQVVILLGIPIALLIFAKVILQKFFPGLGY